MALSIQVTEEDFLEIARKEHALVLKRGKEGWAGITYLIHHGDYYYYTVSKKEIDLPDECEVKKVLQMLL